MDNKRALVQKACEGDKEAFGKLYESVYEDLYRFAVYVLKDCYEAQDAVAETVADAYETIRKLRDADAFRSWIFKILSNKCRKKIREYQKRREEFHENVQQFEERPEEDLDRDLQVRQAFYSLDDEERLIVSMKVFGGYKSQEIGKILHKSHNTVRSRLSRALKKMEDRLE